MRTARRVGAGVSGAAAVVVLDSILTRMPMLNGHPVARAVLRLGGGFAMAEMASRASERVRGSASRAALQSAADGIAAGAVLVTALDAGVSLIGERRLEPPPARTVAELGAPWAPSPPWTAAATDGAQARHAAHLHK